MAKKLPLVEVVWSDIVASSSWYDDKDVTEMRPEKCVSVGFLVRETEELVTLVSTYSPEGDDRWANTICIPKGCILKKLRIR
jgi:hypothetical protein